MNYTKGKWRVYPTNHFHDNAHSLKIALGAGEQSIALIDSVGTPFFKDGWDEMVANANLIAAAPKMHQKGRQALAWIHCQLVTANEITDFDRQVYDELAQALAKAEGKEER